MTHFLKIISLFFIFFPAMAIASGSNNVAIEQLGAGSISVQQAGENNSVIIRQQSDETGQDYQNNIINDAKISQYGRANNAIVTQGGRDLGETLGGRKTKNSATVKQKGDKNTAIQKQDGSSNEMTFDQQGNKNQRQYQQTGQKNTVKTIENNNKTIIINDDGSQIVE